MHQRRICEYFGLACTHNRTFLCLPLTVRLQIYEEAGLDFIGESVNLNWRPEASPFPSSSDNTVFNLLSTCRAVYTELSSILYSTNRFLIRYQEAQNLQSLKILSSTALSAIRHLTIQLNITTTEPGALCCPTYGVDPRKHSKPLKSSCRQHQEALEEWEGVALHVLANFQPSKLCLQFICDVEDIESAQRAVKPLLGINSALAQCDIRLGRSPDPVLRDLAQYVADRATRKHVNQLPSPFRFMDLPVELRLQILKYTDLITPLLEVEWCPARRFGLHYAKGACPGYDNWCGCTPDSHFAFQFRRCGHIARADFNSCFCHRRHAAYSSACHCWAPPTSLFLTCRAFRELALEVFFSENRFIVTPSWRCDEPATHTPQNLEAFLFFTQVVPRNARLFLRFLEIVFPPFEEDYLRITEQAYQQWLQTVKLMKNSLNLPNLTLRIYMADIGAFDKDQGLPDFRRTVTKERGIAIFQMYNRTLQPLIELKGLSKFFVHLIWPFARVKSVLRRHQAEPGFVDGHNKRINEHYEKMVMGDSYDSNLLEKPRISQWLEQSTQDPFM